MINGFYDIIVKMSGPSTKDLEYVYFKIRHIHGIKSTSISDQASECDAKLNTEKYYYQKNCCFDMKCAISEKSISLGQRKKHLDTEHNLDPRLIEWIVEFDDRLSKLEEKERLYG
jgi:hypothetical protein